MPTLEFHDGVGQNKSSMSSLLIDTFFNGMSLEMCKRWCFDYERFRLKLITSESLISTALRVILLLLGPKSQLKLKQRLSKASQRLAQAFQRHPQAPKRLPLTSLWLPLASQ